MQYLWSKICGIVKNIPWYLWCILIGILLFILEGIIIILIAVSVIVYNRYFILVLVISTFIHGLGRLIASKSCKIRADVFAVGFGPTLLKWKRGGTEYRVNAIPVWCYVKIAGDDPNGKDRDAVNEYGSKPIWRRAVIVLSGPAANVVVAFFALWTMCFWGLDCYIWRDSALRIGSVRWNTPADSAGFLVGDSIVSVNGSPVATWDQMYDRIDTLLYKQKRNDYKIVVLRDGKHVAFEQHIELSKKRLSDITDGLSPASVPSIVGKVKPKSGADGVLKVGDTILAFKGVPVSHIEEVYDLMYNKRTPKGDSAATAVDIMRGEKLMRAVVIPKYDSETGYYSLGIESVPEPTRIERYGAIGALRRALSKAWVCSTALFDMISCIANGDGDDRKSAPSMIGDMTFDPRDILYAMGFIGINMAILSLIINAGFLINLRVKAVLCKHQPRKEERDPV
jgi:regulator of sigma E protease